MKRFIILLAIVGFVYAEPIKIKQGKNFFNEGRYIEAINEFDDFTVLYPNSPYKETALLYIARSYNKLGNYLRAIDYYKMLFGYLKDKNKAVYYYYLAAKNYVQIGYFKEAEAIFKEIIDNFPNTKAAFYSRRDLLIISLEKQT